MCCCKAVQIVNVFQGTSRYSDSRNIAGGEVLPSASLLPPPHRTVCVRGLVPFRRMREFSLAMPPDRRTGAAASCGWPLRSSTRFAEAHRRRKGAVAHHLLDGTSRNAERRAEVVLGQERREWFVWHDDSKWGFRIQYRHPAHRNGGAPVAGSGGWKNPGWWYDFATGFSETFLKVLLASCCV